jgi:mannosyltransferase
MTAPELAESPAAARDTESPVSRRHSVQTSALIVAALTVVGFAFRFIVAGQSIFADELSTYWISATHSLGGVLSLLYGTGTIAHAEITPPLSFLLFWLSTRLGHSPELLRLPSLIAGTATIPIVYLIARRTVGHVAGLIATALTALSPFMIYYSTEARAYGLLMLAVSVSTLAILLALDTGRTRWWVIYAVSACAAFYLHYTCVFVLAVQAAWVLWACPQARRAVILASAAAAVGVLPWLPGLINDYRSPTVKILSALSPFTPYAARFDLEHWVIGYPATLTAVGLRSVPGPAALILLACAAALTAVGLVVLLRGGAVARVADLDRRIVLVLALAVATPLGAALESVVGNSIFSIRDLAVSWPYAALAGAAALTATRPPIAWAATAMAVGAFAIGAFTMLDSSVGRPDYQSAANYIERDARAGDVAVDVTGYLSPGPLTGLDVALHRRMPVFRGAAPAERGHPFGFLDPIVPVQQAVEEAVKAAHGHRIFLVTNVFNTGIVKLGPGAHPAPTAFPASYRVIARRLYPGVANTLVEVYRDVDPRASGR